MQPAADCFVSVVAPVHNDATIVQNFVAETVAVLREQYANYELVIVDDGSTDDTFDRLSKVIDEYDSVRIIHLSRAFGEEIAISAGLDSVIGDFVVVILPNTDPPALIPAFVEKARAGAGVVFGVRKSRRGESLLMRTAAKAWYWYSHRFLHLDLPPNSTQFRALSRQAVNAVVRIRDRHRHLRILSGDIGYTHAGIEYEPIARNPDKPARTFLSRVAVSIDIIVSHSSHPLRIVTTLGIAGGTLNVLYAIYVVSIYLFKPDVAAGWTTLSLQNAGMFFLLFVILTVLSEYIGHILVESRDRPLYYVLEERNSRRAVAPDARRNVVTESDAT